MNGSINPISVVRRTFDLYLAHARVLLAASACLAVTIYVLEALPLRALPLLGLVVLLAYLAAAAFFTGAVVRIAAASAEGTPYRNVGQLTDDLRPAFAKLMLVIGVAGMAIGILISFASVIPAVLLIGAALNAHTSVGAVIAGAAGCAIVFIAPAVLLMVRWSVAAPVAVLERPGGLSALGRSGTLVRGNRWRVFGTIVLLGILLVVVGGAADLAGTAAGSSAAFIARALVTLMAGPVPPLAATALYLELRGTQPPLQAPPAPAL